MVSRQSTLAGARMNVVFCKTRHVYDSYADFWRLVRVSAFPTIFIDELTEEQMKNGNTVFIFTPWNGETTPVLEKLRKRKSKLIWWLLERDVCDKGITVEFNRMATLVDAVWVSDRSYENIDPIRLRHVVLGSHPDIATSYYTSIKQYDVCTLAYLWGRRQHIVDTLIHRNISIAPPAYGQDAQDLVIPSSRIMLSMHQYPDARIVAPLRFAVAAAYGLPVITESVDDPFPLVDGEDFVSASYDDLTNAVERFLRNSAKQLEVSGNLQRKLLGEWRFDRSIQRALES